MTLCRLILPEWRRLEAPTKPKVLEEMFSDAQITKLNLEGYGIYHLPNSPSAYSPGTIVTGRDIDTYRWCFVDMDLKDGVYGSKDEFYEALGLAGIQPTRIIDSGGGVHAYWQVSDLDAQSYLRFQRRLCRLFNTDEATTSIYQLMRLPGTLNTKVKGAFKQCEELYNDHTIIYTSEQLDKLLPPITLEDEAKCKLHYDKTFDLNQSQTLVDDTLPPKFGQLLRDNQEAKEIFSGASDDRSRGDFRLGHLMFANGFTREEALSVLVNSAKALQRSPPNRVAYAQGIVDKIWTFELAENKDQLELSSSVRDILQRAGDTIKGTPFRCHEAVDNTVHGFRLGQVIGLVAGSGVGKTAYALNMFRWFAQKNPDYHHFFIPLEQPANEIADRWKTMCGADTSLHGKVHIISNYDEDGGFRHLTFDEIREYIEKFQRVTGNKVGCIVIDHIGALKKKGKNGENQDLMDICHSMKAFAVQTNTLLVMQSQAPREKAGIGDLELNKDAAYGTVFFESYVDYLITLWQPLKRCHSEQACPTVTAFKYCKIRHKKANLDVIKEDVPYYMYFDSDTELMKDMTQDQITSFDYFLSQATNKRKADRKTDLVKYQSVPYKGETPLVQATVDSDRHSRRH